MDQSFSMGGLIPLWILGVPMLAALISMTTMPKRSRSDVRDQSYARGMPAAADPRSSAGLVSARS